MASQGGKGRKAGRNKVKCKRYKDEGRREKNKARKALRANKRQLKKLGKKAA